MTRITRTTQITWIAQIPLIGLLTVAAVTLCAGELSGQASTVVDARVARGRTVYQYWCATCHSSGPGMPGTTALAAKYKGKQPTVPAVLEERADLTAASVRFFVRQGVSVMAPFRKTEISDADLEDLIGYLTRSKAR